MPRSTARPKECDHLLLVCRRAVRKAHSHAAEPYRRDFQVAFSEFALLHSLLLCLSRDSFRSERSHVDGEAVLHVGLQQSFVGFVDLLDGDDFDIGGDVMRPAKVEHLLGLVDATYGRAGETAAPHDEAEGRDAQGFSGAPTRVMVPSRWSRLR